MTHLGTAIKIKALKDQGLTNADIIQLIKDAGSFDTVLELVS